MERIKAEHTTWINAARERVWQRDANGKLIEIFEAEEAK